MSRVALIHLYLVELLLLFSAAGGGCLFYFRFVIVAILFIYLVRMTKQQHDKDMTG
jgi:hypothetical protein